MRGVRALPHGCSAPCPERPMGQSLRRSDRQGRLKAHARTRRYVPDIYFALTVFHDFSCKLEMPMVFVGLVDRVLTEENAAMKDLSPLVFRSPTV